MRRSVVGSVLVLSSIVWADDSPIASIVRQAHAHNDYLHPRPLADALDQGFGSIEADIFLANKELLVAHSVLEIRKDRTLEKLYLDPLLARTKANGGWIYATPDSLLLLIDFKSKGDPTYSRLREVLKPYASMLSRRENGMWIRGAVTIVISGDRPISTIVNDPARMVGIDGRPGDLDSSLPADAMPMISESWNSLFSWKGEGPMPDAERTKLQEIVRRAHAKGRVVRFWATPEKEAVWDELKKAEVDLINTDQLARLRKYLTAAGKP